MGKKVYNLKGEEVDTYRTSTKGDGPLFSWSTILLVGGLVLFNIGCFIQPALLDSAFRCFDVRLWPWWYFPILGVITFFTWFWIKLYFRYNDEGFDSADYDLASRFVKMSLVISVELLLLMLLNSVGVFSLLYWPFYQMFVYGVFSYAALLTLLLVLIGGVIALYYIKEWMTVYLAER